MRLRRRWLLAVAAAITISVVVMSEWPYRNREAFVSPLDQARLTIRRDGRGDGRYGAPRSGRRRHQGIDLAARMGDPVRAVRSGWVAVARYQRGYGNFVVIRHSPVLTTTYAHLKTLHVREGRRVHQGDAIGTVGKTGNAGYAAVRPHLHFEVRRSRVPVDPVATALHPFFPAVPTDDAQLAAQP